jgi:hypothetical protein
MKKRASENTQRRKSTELTREKGDTCPANVEFFAISQIQHKLREAKVNASQKVIALFYDRSDQNIEAAIHKTRKHSVGWMY